MKISIVLEGYLKDKYSFSPTELNYSKAVTIYKVLEDAKISSSAGVFFIRIGDKIVKEDYLLTESAEIKLCQITGGG